MNETSQDHILVHKRYAEKVHKLYWNDARWKSDWLDPSSGITEAHILAALNDLRASLGLPRLISLGSSSSEDYNKKTTL